MARQVHINERPGWLQDVNSMLVSALAHLTALIILGLLAAASSDGWRGVQLLVNAADGNDPASIDDSSLEDAVEMEVAVADPAAAMGPVKLFDTSALATADISALAALTENSAPASGLEGVALAGSGEGEGSTRVAATDFFGIGAYGQTFVYVVDASGSMNDSGKFERACYELLQSIEQLSSDQRYFVVFYNDAAYPMNATEPVLATQDEIAKTARWVNSATADGGTNPLPALLFALSLRPDAIYFLSDGQFDPLTIQQIRSRNRPRNRMHLRQVPIHTIAFVDRATEFLMRTIARQSGGDYRFVE